MKIVYRIGTNSQQSLGVFEAELEINEEIDTNIETIKKLYLKHRLLADNDPAKIRQQIAKTSRRQI